MRPKTKAILVPLAAGLANTSPSSQPPERPAPPRTSRPALVTGTPFPWQSTIQTPATVTKSVIWAEVI